MRFEPILKKILVPVDGTNASLAAQQFAVFLVKTLKPRVTLIHAISQELTSLEYQYAGLVAGGIGMPRGGADRSYEPPPADLIKVFNEIEDSYYQKGEKILADAVAFFKQDGVTPDSKLVERTEPAMAIMNHAHEGSYDLIIMGQSEEDEPHLGSTAGRVARHSEIPVLIVRSARKISKMLIAFDGSQNAERALQYGAYLAKNTGAKMTILYVQRSEFLRLKPEQTGEFENRIMFRASEILDETELDKKVESGDPGKIIIQTAKAGNYDLIVMGSKGHSAVKRFMLGSVCEHVIHYAGTSVLLVR